MHLFGAALALCGMTSLSQAATVSWTTGSLTGTGSTDVIAPSGSLALVSALYFTSDSGSTPLTIGGVSFTNAVAPAGGGTSPSFTETGYGVNLGGVYMWNSSLSPNINSSAAYTDASYATFIESGALVSNGADTPSTLTLTGLTIGTAYEARFWSQTYTGNDIMTWTSGASITGNAMNTANGNLGSWFTASFTADATTQAFTFIGSNQSFDPVNGLELLQAVPEPSTVALLFAASSLIGLGAVRRFRALSAV
jgi:hypothetical protein